MAALGQRVFATARSLTRGMAAPAHLGQQRVLSSAATAGAETAKEPSANHLNSTVRVEDVLAGRGEKVFTTTKDTMVVDAVRLMVERNIGCLIVVGDDGRKAEGVMSERDYLEKIIVLGRTSRTTHVREIMSTKSLVSVTKKSTLNECMVRL
jgi:CBS domain-containing protein